MSHYTHLTIDEREKTMVMLSQCFSIRAIARILKRSPSTITREFARNSKKSGEYSAAFAHKKYQRRRKACGPKPILRNPELADYITARIRLKWTPEQIAGRAKLDNYPVSFSYNTIYRAIENKILPLSLHKEMRFKSKRSKCKNPNHKRGRIQDTVSIHERPAEINERKTTGHWESDTVLGMRKTGCFATHVERITGFLIASKLSNRIGDAFNLATIKVFEAVPPAMKKSFTVDNGIEFTLHKKLAVATGMNIYFCDPYSSWQRGTNENTNGLLRQFFPKRTSFAPISQTLLDDVVFLINNRPRKRLGFKTPAECFNDLCCT